jgi:chemotaxis signal transduction protein
MTDSALARAATALREAFDRSFAEMPAAAGEPLEDFLFIRVGDDPYALRRSHVARLEADRVVVPVPSAMAEFLGMAAFRGSMAPVFDLRALFGHSKGDRLRWLVLANHAARIAFAFDRFEGYVRARTGAPAASSAASPVLREVVLVESGFRPLVDLPALAGVIAARVNQDRKD